MFKDIFFRHLYFKAFLIEAISVLFITVLIMGLSKRRRDGPPGRRRTICVRCARQSKLDDDPRIRYAKRQSAAPLLLGRMIGQVFSIQVKIEGDLFRLDRHFILFQVVEKGHLLLQSIRVTVTSVALTQCLL